MPQMNLVTRTNLSLLLVSLLIATAASLVRGDDLTGLPQNDPKDLLPAMAPPPMQTSGVSAFVPMPAWSRGIIMPPLPYQLKPMGKKPVTAVASTTTSLAPPKDDGSAPATTETPAPKPAPAPESPAMVTVSPFLQWIQSNPQAAAAQARQQANSYNATPVPPPGASGNAPTGPTVNGQDPYWLPPMIDSSTITTGAVGGSAAIYSRPQR